MTVPIARAPTARADHPLLLTRLAPADRERLLNAATTRRFRRGEHLFVQGDPLTELYIVRKGRIRITTAPKKAAR